jgi:hypothetical protein
MYCGYLNEIESRGRQTSNQDNVRRRQSVYVGSERPQEDEKRRDGAVGASCDGIKHAWSEVWLMMSTTSEILEFDSVLES